MSRRALIGILLACCFAPAAAEHWHGDPTLRLGDSNWELYRPRPCAQRLFDLGYVTYGLRAAKPGFGLRFRRTTSLEISLRFDPINDSGDFVGPVYDEHIGATTLTFAVNF